MTTPVTADDLVSGAATYLLSLTDVTTLLGKFDDNTPWIFQRDMPVNMEISDKVAVVVTSAGPWGAPNDYNTASFERLSIQIWAGPIRQTGGVGVVEDSETHRRARAIYRVIDKHLHRVGGGVQQWGSIRSVTSRRFSGYDDYKIPDGNGIVIGTQIYGVEIG